jgi:hypothetical protein
MRQSCSFRYFNKKIPFNLSFVENLSLLILIENEINKLHNKKVTSFSWTSLAQACQTQTITRGAH